MVRQKLLLISLLSAIIILSVTEGVPALAKDLNCTPTAVLSGACGAPPTANASTDGHSVNVGAERLGRNSGAAAGPDRAGDGAPSVDSEAFDAGATGGLPPGVQPIVRADYSVTCVPLTPCDESHFSVSASDLINFAPVRPTATMEPNGWAVVGLPANFIALAEGGVQSGMLLGYQASVRFTPLSYAWSYGDGSSRTTASRGSTWRALGVPEFSPTATSHEYAASGTYAVQLTVRYGAQYRYAGLDWHDVIGTVTASAGSLAAVAGEAKTVLVNRDCVANPRGPGC
jgi:hypothetical protein